MSRHAPRQPAALPSTKRTCNGTHLATIKHPAIPHAHAIAPAGQRFPPAAHHLPRRIEPGPSFPPTTNAMAETARRAPRAPHAAPLLGLAAALALALIARPAAAVVRCPGLSVTLSPDDGGCDSITVPARRFATSTRSSPTITYMMRGFNTSGFEQPTVNGDDVTFAAGATGAKLAWRPPRPGSVLLPRRAHPACAFLPSVPRDALHLHHL